MFSCDPFSCSDMPVCNRPREGFVILTTDSEVHGALMNYERMKEKFSESGLPVTGIFRFRSKTGFRLHCDKEVAERAVGGSATLPLSGEFRVVPMRYYLDLGIITEHEVDTACIVQVLAIAASCQTSEIEIEKILGVNAVRARVISTELWMSLHRMSSLTIEYRGARFEINALREGFKGVTDKGVSELSERMNRMEEQVQRNLSCIEENSKLTASITSRQGEVECRFDKFESRLEARLDLQVDRLRSRLEDTLRDVLIDANLAPGGKRRK